MFSSADAFYLEGFPFVLGFFFGFYSSISMSLLDFIIKVFIIYFTLLCVSFCIPDIFFLLMLFS